MIDIKRKQSYYLEKEVDALDAFITFDIKDEKDKVSSLKMEGYWLKTGEIEVNGFIDYEDFILSMYKIAFDKTIVKAFIEVKDNPSCESAISANSNKKGSYTNVDTIKQEINQIKLIQKEKKKLNTTLKKTKNNVSSTNKQNKNSKNNQKI